MMSPTAGNPVAAKKVIEIEVSAGMESGRDRCISYALMGLSLVDGGVRTSIINPSGRPTPNPVGQGVSDRNPVVFNHAASLLFFVVLNHTTAHNKVERL